ncbi:RIP metalloprotease RseP [Candidatus Paracaedibacter symbiosus]|uniref:RIP metalloprotease RseP n=1 Tax=Candidatus Paracaedibacter symbiosus TaxID=244582 RepID=UPI00050940F6|nr:RIP metalloprotease RseP [Candidatus Paracaedibacter symbiosus]
MSYLLGNITEYVIPFLIVLTVLVFIHELGHYLVARWNGVKIDVFSIGFGPEIFGWTDKAQTRWKFSLIPLGGYVRMYGDADSSSRADSQSLSAMDEAEKAKTLHGKTVGQRMAVVAAGPIANYLLAMILMTGIFAIKGEPIINNQIGGVIAGSVAEHLGLQKDDRIIKINETPVSTFDDIRALIPPLKGQDIRVTVERPEEGKAEKATVIATGKMAQLDAETKEFKPTQHLGVRPGGMDYQQLGLLAAIGQAAKTCYKMTVDTLASIGQMLTFNRSSSELVGILGMGEMAGESAKSGLVSLFWFMAILSVNLGMVNLLPIPVLDGGHLVFYAIEGIRGKPVSVRAQEIAFTVGLVIVLFAMFLSTKNDLVRFNILSWFKF